MALVIPPNVKNYSSPLNSVPLNWTEEAPEGPKGIQCAITWNAAQSGPNKAVYLNMQNNAPLNFSKIRAIVVDNSANGSDVQVVFPDTETTFTVPAYTPYAIVPVFTNQTQLYILSPLALATDKTAFMVLNTLPPPLAVPVTQAQNLFSSVNIDVAVSGSLQIVPTTVNGTLENVFISTTLNGTPGNVDLSVVVKDGLGNALLNGSARNESGGSVVTVATLFEASGLHVRFSGGLVLEWTTVGAPALALLTPNLYYRTP